MAHNPMVTMVVDSKDSGGDQMEEPLVEIKNINHINNHLSFNKQLKILKISTVISTVMVIILFLFLFLYFNWRIQYSWIDMTHKIEDLEIKNNKTTEMSDSFHAKHKHLNVKTENHQNITIKYLKKAKAKYEELEEATKAVEEFEKQHNLTDGYIWNELPEIEWNTNLSGKILYSPVFTLRGYNVSGRMVVEKLMGKLEIYTQFINSDQSSTSNTTVSLSEVKYVIMKSESITISSTGIEILSCKFNQSALDNNAKHFNYTYYTYHSRYYTHNYSIKLFLKVPRISPLIFSTNGILIWKINARNLTIKDFERQSPYFYSHPNGYRMTLKLHYSYSFHFQMYILCGENDYTLPSKFPFKTILTIFNQENIWGNLISTKTHHKGVNESPITLQSLSELSQYTSKNNTILVKLEVELLNVDEE
ncbi:hypothetical protein CHUAL_011663 [Chamberlinius hualienensis]